MAWPKEVIIYTDGASRGNPGPAAIGVYVKTPRGKIVAEIAEPLGEQTNNFAEYTAVVRGLAQAFQNGVKKLTLRSDSQLLIRQLTGEYSIKSETLRPLYLECQKLIKKFSKINFEHVGREFNKDADRLANRALDEQYN